MKERERETYIKINRQIEGETDGRSSNKEWRKRCERTAQVA